MVGERAAGLRYTRLALGAAGCSGARKGCARSHHSNNAWGGKALPVQTRSRVVMQDVVSYVEPLEQVVQDAGAVGARR